jgi:hypothetical protein
LKCTYDITINKSTRELVESYYISHHCEAFMPNKVAKLPEFPLPLPDAFALPPPLPLPGAFALPPPLPLPLPLAIPVALALALSPSPSSPASLALYMTKVEKYISKQVDGTTIELISKKTLLTPLLKLIAFSFSFD